MPGSCGQLEYFITLLYFNYKFPAPKYERKFDTKINFICGFTKGMAVTDERSVVKMFQNIVSFS